jgi:hypothetical protein
VMKAGDFFVHGRQVEFKSISPVALLRR